MSAANFTVDVLCVGNASYDLIFCVDAHPAADEKIMATALLRCGGGPAANAAVAAARLGYRAAFAGYLGNDIYGEMHCAEFQKEGVNVDLIVRGEAPTPLSAILVKPDGKRTVVNHGAGARPLAATSIDFSQCAPRAILFDGHEPALSMALVQYAKTHSIPMILDAGSLHRGTQALAGLVDYVVASEKFGAEFTGADDVYKALQKLSIITNNVVITLGERGLIWKNPAGEGSLPAFNVTVIDTTGAGDAFHGAFAAGIASGMKWDNLLQYASVVAALSCTRMGGRLGLPYAHEVNSFLGTFR